MGNKLPAFQFYPGDWMKDPELRSVSSGARGLWIDMLSLMFESARRGYLQFNNGKSVTAESLARMTGNSTDDASRWLQELEYSGVLSRTDDGTIYSRRQVRDETTRGLDRDRKRKERSCPENVTRSVTALSVDEDEEEKEVAVEVEKPKTQENCEKFDGEEWVRAILNAHPMPEWGQLVQTYVIDSIEFEMKARSWSKLQACEYLLARTQLYAQITDRWPLEEKRKFRIGAKRFFEGKIYNQNEEVWKREQQDNIESIVRARGVAKSSAK